MPTWPPQIIVLDLQEQMPGVQRLRDWTLAALDPQPGERAVDVGSGTGTEVRRLAGLVGTDGEAIGVEPHPGMRAEAEIRAAPRATLPGSSTATRCRCRSRTGRSTSSAASASSSTSRIRRGRRVSSRGFWHRAAERW